MFTFFGPLQEQWSKVLWLANSQVFDGGGVGQVDPNPDEKENC